MVKREYIKKILKEYVKEKKTFNIILEQSTSSFPSDVKGTLTKCIPCKEFEITKEKSTVVYLKNQTKRGGFAIKVSGTNDPSITRYYFIDGAMIENANGVTKVMDDKWDYTKCAQESVEQDDEDIDVSQKTSKEAGEQMIKYQKDYSRKGCAGMINAFYRASELYEQGVRPSAFDDPTAATYREKIKFCKAKFYNKWLIGASGSGRRLDGNRLNKKLDALYGYRTDRFTKANPGSPYLIEL
tara:strand:+ start:2180 stop:2902 length:723 start_codon:yes stop_codon:yes gene_type:complete